MLMMFLSVRFFHFIHEFSQNWIFLLGNHLGQILPKSSLTSILLKLHVVSLDWEASLILDFTLAVGRVEKVHFDFQFWVGLILTFKFFNVFIEHVLILASPHLLIGTFRLSFKGLGRTIILWEFYAGGCVLEPGLLPRLVNLKQPLWRKWLSSFLLNLIHLIIYIF